MRSLFILLALSLPLLSATDAAPAWKWEASVAKLEGYNANPEVPRGAIVFVGSSSITSWGSLKDDLAGLPVLPRGFGGSVTKDQVLALPRILLPLKPKVVVYYCGDNDLAKPDRDPQVAVDGFVAWLDALHAELPETRVLYLAIKPSTARIACWPIAQEANKRIKALCETRTHLTFVDVATPLLDDQGVVRDELFKQDHLHLNPEGYKIWTAVIRPAVEKAWAEVSGA